MVRYNFAERAKQALSTEEKAALEKHMA